MEKENKKESHISPKKKIVIISLVALLLLGLGVGGYFFYQYKELKKPIKQEWGQKYYMYLKDVNENNKQENAGLPKNLKTSELSFYDIENVKDPVMVIDYKKENEEYSNFYYIYEYKINVLTYQQPTKIELLYNIDNKKYDYYSHVKEKDSNKYKSISEQIKERINELEKGRQTNNEQKVEEITEYTFNSDSVDKVTDVNGKEISLTKFDQTFVKPDIKEDTINYSFDLEEKDLKEAITNQIEEYKPVDKVVTKEVETQIEKKIEETSKTKEEMVKAKAEVEKKQAEEKAKKEAEEKAKKEAEEKAKLAAGLKVGSQTLKYGTYTTSVPHGGINGADLYGTITLKPDGKFHIKTNFEQSSGEAKVVDEDGTYTTGKSMNSYDSQDTIFFTTNSGYKFSYFVTNSSYFNSQWIIYKYSGN